MVAGNKALNSSAKVRRVSAGSSSQDEGDARLKSLGTSLESVAQSCVSPSPTKKQPSVSGSGSLCTEYLADEGVSALPPSSAASPQHNTHSSLTPATSVALTELSADGMDREGPPEEMEDEHQEEAGRESVEEDDTCHWHEPLTFRDEMFEVLDQVSRTRYRLATQGH